MDLSSIPESSENNSHSFCFRLNTTETVLLNLFLFAGIVVILVAMNQKKNYTIQFSGTIKYRLRQNFTCVRACACDRYGEVKASRRNIIPHPEVYSRETTGHVC